MNITYSTELMSNYNQSNVISPQKKFKAIQNNEGEALLFSIGTDSDGKNGKFYLIEQGTGVNNNGWQEIDLSSKLAEKSLPGGVAKDFAVAQNPSNGKIDLVLVMSVDSKDTLYLSLGHSNEKNTITSDIVWSAQTFDDPNHPGISLDIEDVYISQSSHEEYIVADISESSFTPPSDFLKRYYIDPAKTSGTVWNKMAIGGDLDPGIQTCMGRKSGERVDGTYTLGKINNESELLYAPLYNPFDINAPVTITRLIMPKGASAIDVAQNTDGTTDLFVAAGSDIYFFAADKQQDNASGEKILSNSLFLNVSKIYAYKSSTKYIVFGLNRDDQVFYTSCDLADILQSSKWLTPLPIITGVDKISPYINRKDDASTIFSADTNEIKISVRSPETTIWNTQTVQLDAPPQSEAKRFSSYTTRVQLDDGDNNPLSNTQVMISTNSPISVYINNLYYLLNTTPIPITSDQLGSITIIDAVSGLDTVQLTVAGDNTSLTINPMHKPFNKITALDTAAKLRDAYITSPDGTKTDLIGKDIPDGDLESVAQSNKNLSSAYLSVTSKKRQLQATSARSAALPGNLANAIETDIGDLFKWLESGIKHTIELIENEVTGLWHFIVKIGDEIYQGVLDSIEAVVGAVRWIYNAIKVAIEDLIKFLEFLFEWDDITRTKDVLKNMIKQYLQHEADQIEVVKNKINQEINQLVSTINDWAGIDDWSGLGQAATQPVDSSSTPNKNSTAPGDMISFHFNNNVGNLVQHNPPAPLDPQQSPIDTLFNALKKEGVVLDAVLDQFKELSSEFSTLDLETIIKRIIAIIADGVLESAEVVIDAMLDIIYELVSAVLDALDTDIYIPIVSDILKDFGVPSASFLDLFCWITAVPITISYKIAENKAPFPDDANTTFLKNAASWSSIEQAFSSNTLRAAQDSESTLITMSDSVKSAVFISGHTASGFFTLMSCFVSTFEAEAETGENPFSTPSAILGVLSAGTAGIAGVLVPKDPIKNSVVSWVNKATTGSVILSKLIFSGPAQSKFGASSGIMQNLKAADGRATGAVVNSILVIPALVCTCWHFYELTEEADNSTRSAAIIDETANITSYISRISYMVAVNDEDPESKQIPIGIMVVANIVTGGLQTAEAIVGA